MRVATADGKGRLAKLSFHLCPARDDGCGLIKAHAIFGRLDGLKLDLSRTDECEEGRLRNLRSAHQVNQDEVVRQDVIQRLRVTRNERGEELLSMVSGFMPQPASVVGRGVWQRPWPA